MTIHHFLAPFDSENQSARIAITMSEKLFSEGQQVALWSDREPIDQYKSYGVNVIRTYQGQFPNSGSLTVVGFEATIEKWYEQSCLDVVKLFVYQHDLQGFIKTLHQLTMAGTRTVRLEYANRTLADRFALD